MPDEDRAWHYFIDAEGHLSHEGSELDDPALLKFFMEKMERLPDGRFHVLCQGEDCYITAEDVPYVVQDVAVEKEGIRLRFPGGYEEALDPATLKVGQGNVLYCTIRKGAGAPPGAFRARFNRKSYLELARHVRYDPKKKSYFITLAKTDYPIEGVIDTK